MNSSTRSSPSPFSNVPTPRRRERKDPAETLSKHHKDSGRYVTIFGRCHHISHRSDFVRRESCGMRSRTAQDIIEAADLFDLLPGGVPRWPQSKDAENGSKAYDGPSAFDFDLVATIGEASFI